MSSLEYIQIPSLNNEKTSFPLYSLKQYFRNNPQAASALAYSQLCHPDGVRQRMYIENKCKKPNDEGQTMIRPNVIPSERSDEETLLPLTKNAKEK